mgnify:FL=1
MAEAYAKHKLDDGVEEVTGFCDKAIVKVDSPWGLILFIVNIFVPGAGSVASAFMDSKFNVMACIFGIV